MFTLSEPSSKVPAATLTYKRPGGVGRRLGDERRMLAGDRLKTPFVPPVSSMSSFVKLVPTFSLKAKSKVTSPVAISLRHVVGDGDRWGACCRST